MREKWENRCHLEGNSNQDRSQKLVVVNRFSPLTLFSGGYGYHAKKIDKKWEISVEFGMRTRTVAMRELKPGTTDKSYGIK